MRPWADDLAKSIHPSLQAMAPELKGLIDAADKALAARADTMAQIRSFRDVGARRQLFDKVNAARKAADGDLAKIAIQTPGLSNDYPSRFFRAAPADDEEDAPTIESVTAEIADLQNKLGAAKDLLDKLQKDDAAVKQAEAQKQADEAELAALQQQGGDLAKQIAALQAKLGKK